jgi:biotin operon repressor
MQSFELPPEPVIKQHRPVDMRKYSIVPIRAIADRRLRPATYRALLAVCSYANRAGLLWAGHENIGKMLGVTRQAAGRQVKKLIEWGYLQKVKNHSWGKTAQILRVVYDESISNRQHMDAVNFDDKPPTLQAWELKKSIEHYSDNTNKEPIEEVAITPNQTEGEVLSVDELVKLWKNACTKNNINRVITPEDMQSAAWLVSANLRVDIFEGCLKDVFNAWQAKRIEPPHRLAWFKRLVNQ